MQTATWYVEKQPEGGFLMWLEEDPERPLPARDLAELERQCRANSILDDSFADIRTQLETVGKATIKVPTLGRFSIG